MRTWILLRIATALLLGVVAGVVWQVVAEPAQWTATETSLVMTAEESAQNFGVVLAFIVIGLIVAGMWGASFGAASRGNHPTSLLFIMGLSVLASVVAYRVGVWLGPADPEDATGLSVGDLVEDRLGISTWVPFLAWPFGVTLGVFSSTLFLSRLPGDGGDHRTREADQVAGGEFDLPAAAPRGDQ